MKMTIQAKDENKIKLLSINNMFCIFNMPVEFPFSSAPLHPVFFLIIADVLFLVSQGCIWCFAPLTFVEVVILFSSVSKDRNENGNQDGNHDGIKTEIKMEIKME